VNTDDQDLTETHLKVIFGDKSSIKTLLKAISDDEIQQKSAYGRLLMTRFNRNMHQYDYRW